MTHFCGRLTGILSSATLHGVLCHVGMSNKKQQLTTTHDSHVYLAVLTMQILKVSLRSCTDGLSLGQAASQPPTLCPSSFQLIGRALLLKCVLSLPAAALHNMTGMGDLSSGTCQTQCIPPCELSANIMPDLPHLCRQMLVCKACCSLQEPHTVSQKACM